MRHTRTDIPPCPPTSCVNVSAPPRVQGVLVRKTFDTKETVEMAIREWFRQQSRGTCCDENCKFKPKWQKIVTMDYGDK